ncbi:MAG: cobyrinic acid a,c-diamide synthase, partial [Paracoccaceae bacterium]
LETSFADRRLHLGYRRLEPLGGPWTGPLNAHEFHYATTLVETGEALFCTTDAEGTALGTTGLRNGQVTGSFQHVICAAGAS